MSDIEKNHEDVHAQRATHPRRRHAGRYLLTGIVLGALILAGIRFMTFTGPEHTHYHANFALFVNGQQDTFKLPTYYEEVQLCSEDNSSNPRARIHMHNQESGSVHVHDDAATWGHLFANLGYTLGDSVLKTPQGVFVDGQDGKKLQFWLNGQPVIGAANRTVGDKDRLLISYGTESREQLAAQFQAVPQTAERLDNSKDPAACAGETSVTVIDRLKAAIGWPQAHGH